MSVFAVLKAKLRHQPRPHESCREGRTGSYSITCTITFTISVFRLFIKARLARELMSQDRGHCAQLPLQRTCRLPPPEVMADNPNMSSFAGVGKRGALLDSFQKAPLVWGREPCPGQPHGPREGDISRHRAPSAGGLRVIVVEMEGTVGSEMTNSPFHRCGHGGPRHVEAVVGADSAGWPGLEPESLIQEPILLCRPCSARGSEAAKGQAGLGGRRPARRRVVTVTPRGSCVRLLFRAGSGGSGTSKLLGFLQQRAQR